MSQAKVDKYKHEKANRKAILKREKRKQIAGQITGIIICAALVGWIGYSIYDSAEKKAATSQTEVDVSALTDYLNRLTETDTDKDTDQDTTGAEDNGTDESNAGEDNADDGDAEA